MKEDKNKLEEIKSAIMNKIFENLPQVLLIFKVKIAERDPSMLPDGGLQMSQLNSSRGDLSQLEVIQSGFKRQLDQIGNSLKLLEGDTQSLGTQM